MARSDTELIDVITGALTKQVARTHKVVVPSAVDLFRLAEISADGKKQNNRWASAVREKDNEAIKTKRWWLVEDIYGDGRLTTKRAGWIEMSTTLEKEMEIPGVVVVVGIKDWSGFPSSQAAFLQTSQTTPMSGDWMGINTEKVVCALDANI